MICSNVCASIWRFTWCVVVVVYFMLMRLDQCDASCYKMCHCGPVHVYCDGRNITRIPNGMPQSVEVLHLSNNHIQEVLNHSVPKMGNLRQILLPKNLISKIQVAAFHTLYNLEVLNLNDNQIRQLLVGTFDDLKKLRTLDLGHNEIDQISPKLFLHVTKLEVLVLDQNNLHHLDVRTFSKLTLLTSLDLSSNPLKQLHASGRLLQPLTSLKELFLSDTEMQVIHKRTFSKQEKIQRLDISRNKFTNFDPQVFQHMSMLKHFNLSGNPLKCDCKMKPFWKWINKHTLQAVAWTSQTAPMCVKPKSLSGKALYQLTEDTLNCGEYLMPNKYRSSQGPLPYDPMMGIGTAATLSGMLVLFLLCVAFDKAKRNFFKRRRERRARREKYKQEQERKTAPLDHRFSLDGMDSVSMQVDIQQQYEKRCNPLQFSDALAESERSQHCQYTPGRLIAETSL